MKWTVIKSSCPKYRALLIIIIVIIIIIIMYHDSKWDPLYTRIVHLTERSIGKFVRWTIARWNHDFCTDTKISRSVRHWIPFEKITQYTRRLRLYELRRKEPLYNPRWPPPWRGLLLANTKQEAPPWLTARDGMIYWDFCLFALRYNEHIVPSSPRW